jgi:hypothetical protein
MATADERETVSDEDFFDAALSGKEEPTAATAEKGQEEPKGEAEQAEAKAEGERERDERGRFAGKAKAECEQAQEQAKPGQERDSEERIPGWRLREEAENRRRAEERAQAAEREREAYRAEVAVIRRQLAEKSKPKEEPVDLFSNPDGFVQSLEQRISRQFETRFLNQSLGRAARQHGETFNQAFQALQATRDRGLVDRIRASDDPGEAVLDWHRQQSALREIGTDPNAYKQKLRDELSKDPEFRKQIMDAIRAEAGGSHAQGQGQRSAPSVIDMPSLSRSPTASRGQGEENQSDEDFFNSNLRLKRR